MNIPQYGMNPMYLSAACFDSLSAIIAIYLFHLLTVTACYIPQTVYFNFIFFLKNKIETSTYSALRICNLTKFSFSIIFRFHLEDQQHFFIRSFLYYFF
jgi:hypothetical protein